MLICQNKSHHRFKPVYKLLLKQQHLKMNCTYTLPLIINKPIMSVSS